MKDGEPAVDGGDGNAWVNLDAKEEASLSAMTARLQSDQDSDPMTGAELGSAEAVSDDLK
jgi:Mn-containing catalase